MNILYLNRGMGVGGVEKCIIKLSKLFNNSNNKIIVASSGGELTCELKNMNIKHYNIINTDSKNPINILKNLTNIYKIIKKEDINIIHSQHRMTTLLARIVSNFTNVKVIHTQHLCMEDKFKLTKLALKNVQIITVSEAAKRILIEKSNLDEKKITTIYNTIDTECKNKKVDNKLINLKKKGYFIVAQVSRIIDYKGVYDFVEVAKQTNLENQKVKFVLIGDGPELNNLTNTIKQNKLDEVVYLLGAKDNVIEHLKYIDVLILCSYIEGLPLAPLEAFSQGIPVIATNIDGTNEEIINGKNGYLVFTGDIEKFKENILKLHSNRELLKKMKENSEKMYVELFNEKIYINKHRKIYDETIS
ncbi:glycosyltransferase family 4 protein [Clostridium botulinum]|uniref:glycosyltransferase n=1 Tax=Clostridium botulinum TaxID=1491 RepID=UPI0013F135C8|nr:glycosyltransferase [Clostridium botulinum]MBY6917956.1 glycosyltransferase [Clostridium botulinum]NFL35845.1 glycosyltransferase family 4 protein [Clostridium botulinum]NFM05041.1 glycosyltransferase family 4 protein [Clostridium botulinum]NFO40968.1 glycosyltransferase family 4 protein [Clostridium botulinum]NFQ38999.1 glycosyltransferase family 4 protein [Clostridium botulinum]